MDTWAKKIWRYNANGFELISDQLVQRFLNDNITMVESDWTPTVALKNVKTHYNAYKGDIMFTFYKESVYWNLCYNERINKFTTRYSWLPLLSENIQNSYISIDKKGVEPFVIIAETQTKERGLTLETNNNNDYLFQYKKKLTEVFSVAQSNDIGNEKYDEDFIEPNACSIQENTCLFNRSFTLQGYELCNDMIGHIRSVTMST